MKTTICILALTSLNAVSGMVQAQDEGFLYGKVYTDDQIYEGPIRWGKEEVYWCDMFNAAKEENTNLDHLTAQDRDALEEQLEGGSYHWHENVSKWFHETNWVSGSKDFLHQFSCQFGEIRSIQPTGSKNVTVEMKNGQKVKLDGDGYNDVGLDIKVYDKELGEVEVFWNRLEKVEFMNTPKRLENKFGEPLFGTVEAFGNEFKGLIQWDLDERLTTDKLDGTGEDGSLSIEFGKIRSIERRANKSVVVLKSGREVTLGGSNDVSSGHRGVMIMNSQFAAINVPWSEFGKIVFEDRPRETFARYSDFKAPGELQGTITTRDGKSLSGKIIYDLDESHDFELLQGKEGDIEYAIPFRNIKSISTNGSKCGIVLVNDHKISLDDAQDVNERNQGMLVFAGDAGQPTYVPWKDVKTVDLK